jgi:hypothetical protein
MSIGKASENSLKKASMNGYITKFQGLKNTKDSENMD